MAQQDTKDIYALALEALEEDEAVEQVGSHQANKHRQIQVPAQAQGGFTSDSDAFLDGYHTEGYHTDKYRADEYRSAFISQDDLSLIPDYEGLYPNSRKPIAVITSDDLENQRPPKPRLFAQERAHALRKARAGEVVYKPQLPQSSKKTLAALVAACIMVLFVAYALLVSLNKLPAPAILMYGSSRSAGVSLTQASDFSKIPQYKAENFSNEAQGQELVSCAEAIVAATQSASKVYAELGKELAQGGIPDLKAIKQKTEASEQALRQARNELESVDIPQNLSSAEARQYLEKSALDAKALLEQCQNTLNALYLASSGRPSAFTDASYAASNVNRNKENLFNDIHRAARALGLKSQE